MGDKLSVELSTSIIAMDDSDDELSRRSIDLTIFEADANRILKILFDGFKDRLKAAGVEVEIGNFST